ncbi:ferredoxin III, nif-specific [Teredinibacter turnerae]|uniref:ferredoxin III, nif-specific n=1 Tax=Teredinibacter turnerae TaxID=2426 RepID=UPI000366A77A|nr:ferredoxin III, nif-specific [Teredinibacter turnerae]
MSDEVMISRTRGGEEWTPEFVTALNASTCIGCGRCYKVCPRDVFELVDRGDLVEDMDDDEDYDDDDEMKVMAIKNEMDCIGCKSCSRVCPKNCHTHEPMAA